MHLLAYSNNVNMLFLCRKVLNIKGFKIKNVQLDAKSNKKGKTKDKDNKSKQESIKEKESSEEIFEESNEEDIKDEDNSHSLVISQKDYLDKK